MRAWLNDNQLRYNTFIEFKHTRISGEARYNNYINLWTELQNDTMKCYIQYILERIFYNPYTNEHFLKQDKPTFTYVHLVSVFNNLFILITTPNGYKPNYRVKRHSYIA